MNITEQLVAALEYHQQQTRPIQSTIDALAAYRAAPSRAEPQAPAGEPLRDVTGVAARLRRVCKLVGLETAVPSSDAELVGVMFSVLGMVASKLDTRAALTPEAAHKAGQGETIIVWEGNR